MMKPHWPALITLLFCCSMWTANAQNKTEHASLSDSIKIMDWLQEAKSLYGYTTEALTLTDKAMKLSKQLGSQRLIGESYYRLAWYYSVQHNVSLADANCDSAIMAYTKINYKKGIAQCLGFRAITMSSYGSQELAIQEYLKARQLYYSIKDTIGAMTISNNLGVLYNDNDRFTEAKAEHTKSLQYNLSRNDTTTIARSHYNLGVSYMGLQQYREALNNFAESYKLRSSQKREWGQAESLEGIGKTIILLEKSVQKNSIDHPYNFSNNPIELLSEALRIAIRIEGVGLQLRIYETMIQYFENNKMFERGFQTQQKLQQLLHNTALSSENLASFVKMEDKLKSEMQRNQILQLESENRITSLETKSRLRERNFLIGLLFGLVVLVYFILRSMKERLKLRTLESSFKEKEIIRLQQNHELKIMNALIEGGEHEKERISRDLHDSVGNMLTTTKLKLSALTTAPIASSQDELERLMTIVDSTHQEVRNISHNMMPVSLKRLGLIRSIRELCRRQNETDQTFFSFSSDLDNVSLSKQTEIMTYRIVQEIVQNIQKHANASEASIEVSLSQSSIRIEVIDNGIGWDNSIENQGSGLKGLASRVDFLNGTMKIITSPGHGSNILLHLPMEAKGMAS